MFEIITTPLLRTKYFYCKKTYRWIKESDLKSVILNCRLVCRSWNKAIDYLFHHEWKIDWDIRTTALSDQSKLIPKCHVVGEIIAKCFNFSSLRTQQIIKFISEFGSCNFKHSSIFLGRGVSITFEEGSTYDLFETEFYPLLTDFLETFGQHVFHFKIAFNYCTKSREFYNKVIELLTALPNLQTIQITDVGTSATNPIPTLRRLPTWKNLISVKFSNVCTSLSNAIICDAVTLKKLCIKRHAFKRCTISDLNLSGGFEYLEQLELWDCNWEELRTLNLSSYPLKRLQFDYKQVSSMRISWLELFQFISEKFGQTLQELVLILPKLSEEEGKRFKEESQVARLNLPKVKKVNLAARKDCSFDFLLGMSESLEWLHICAEKWQKMLVNGIVNIVAYHDKINDSNVWELFPKLKTVEMSEVEYEMVSRSTSIYFEGQTSKWVKKKISSRELNSEHKLSAGLFGCGCIPSVGTTVESSSSFKTKKTYEVQFCSRSYL